MTNSNQTHEQTTEPQVPEQLAATEATVTYVVQARTSGNRWQDAGVYRKPDQARISHEKQMVLWPHREHRMVRRESVDVVILGGEE